MCIKTFHLTLLAYRCTARSDVGSSFVVTSCVTKTPPYQLTPYMLRKDLVRPCKPVSQAAFINLSPTTITSLTFLWYVVYRRVDLPLDHMHACMVFYSFPLCLSRNTEGAYNGKQASGTHCTHRVQRRLQTHATEISYSPVRV
jgi:hypothetical protein